MRSPALSKFSVSRIELPWLACLVSYFYETEWNQARTQTPWGWFVHSCIRKGLARWLTCKKCLLNMCWGNDRISDGQLRFPDHNPKPLIPPPLLTVTCTPTGRPLLSLGHLPVGTQVRGRVRGPTEKTFWKHSARKVSMSGPGRGRLDTMTSFLF